MKQESMDLRQALAEGTALPYALIFTFGGVSLGPTPETVPEEELMEARFFSEEREIHVWRSGETLRAACISDTAEDEAEKPIQYKLENAELGECIAVKRYLACDEDGQAYIAARRLADWKGGNSHG